MKEIITLPIVGQFIVFEELQKGDNLLFFYDKNIEARQIFQSSLQSGLENKQVCLCAFDKDNAWADMSEKNIILPLSHVKYKDTFTLDELLTKISNIDIYAEKGNTQFKLLIDFGNIVNRGNIDLVIDCEKAIINKIEELKRRHKFHKNTYEKNYLISSAVTAFNILTLDVDTIKQLINLPKKITVFLRDYPKFCLPNFIINRQLDSPPIDTISHESMEKFVKNNIEMIILWLLKMKLMSGYDIIKNIASKFHVYLNQGNVYPLLYSLKSKGVLKEEFGKDGRAKLYFITKEAENNINNKLEEFIKIVNHFACLNRNV